MDYNDMLLHYGKKGMKWGVRKVTNGVMTRVKEGVDSKKREYGFVKDYANRDKMSTPALQKKVNRFRTENNLKRVATTGAQKKVYRNRAKLSDKELTKVFNRYNLEAQFKNQVSSVVRADRKRAKAAIQAAATIPMGDSSGAIAFKKALASTGAAL